MSSTPKSSQSVIDIDLLKIVSPKRSKNPQSEWESIFPYYAGFPQSFVSELLDSSELGPQNSVLDPWNGSGTTTACAARHGIPSTGIDINPVMALVARARLLSSSTLDVVSPLAIELSKGRPGRKPELAQNDELRIWFTDRSVQIIRVLESRLRSALVSDEVLQAGSLFPARIADVAAFMYVVLFRTCRSFLKSFGSSNPTWIKRPKNQLNRVEVDEEDFRLRFRNHARHTVRMFDSAELAGRKINARPSILIGDTSSDVAVENSFDFIVTSPPYCTRIDYSIVTAIELAILAPTFGLSTETLRTEMLGTTLSPRVAPEIDERWGDGCQIFLEALFNHPSKASKTYYYKTHLDYFDKMFRSLTNIKNSLSEKGAMVLVVQDSYYKEIHNDVPSIVSEMLQNIGLKLNRREDFSSLRDMARVNAKSRKYRKHANAVESVLCFRNA